MGNILVFRFSPNYGTNSYKFGKRYATSKRTRQRAPTDMDMEKGEARPYVRYASAHTQPYASAIRSSFGAGEIWKWNLSCGLIIPSYRCDLFAVFSDFASLGYGIAMGSTPPATQLR
ncbi:hypothetical protein Trydic_g15742 [Trypoxylus dichotomus]